MSLRDAMPQTAAFIDELRKAFGAEMIDAQIRKAMKGEPDCFYAEEAGHQVGTPIRHGKSFDAPMPYRPEAKR
jgi:hypothetical protein